MTTQLKNYADSLNKALKLFLRVRRKKNAVYAVLFSNFSLICEIKSLEPYLLCSYLCSFSILVLSVRM